MTERVRPPRIFMMDLWAIVPYYTAYLSKALLAEGANVTVGSISYYLDPSCFTSRGIQVDPGMMDVVGKFNLPRLPRRVLKLMEAMLNLAALRVRFAISRPDVIHVQYLPMLKMRLPLDFWFLEFCRKRGSKLVLTVHDLLPHDTGEVHRKTFQRLYLMMDRIICHSDHIRARLSGEFPVSEEKIAVIPHGPFFYDLPGTGSHGLVKSLGIESDEVMVLWQGIIFPYKGIDLLLDAWQKVEAASANACLLIAGTGAPELLEQIQEQVRRLNLKQVKFCFRFVSSEELVALYRAADIVVYPYRAITTSGALATGLALGKTIVASNLPVFRELLTTRENALLVDPQNAGELGGALVELVQHPELREQFAAKIRALNFGDNSWRSIAAATIEAYDAVLNETTAALSTRAK